MKRIRYRPHGSYFAPPNGTVHRAAANDFDFRTRAARGSVCNGLFGPIPWRPTALGSYHGILQATRHGAKYIRGNRNQQHDDRNCDFADAVTCHVVMMSRSNKVYNNTRVGPFLDSRYFRNRNRNCGKNLPHSQNHKKVGRIAGGLKSQMQLRLAKVGLESSVGENIAGKFQWVKSCKPPLGTESQRCQIILRWKSVIA